VSAAITTLVNDPASRRQWHFPRKFIAGNVEFGLGKSTNRGDGGTEQRRLAVGEPGARRGGEKKHDGEGGDPRKRDEKAGFREGGEEADGRG
jgi:hypothetical protein